MGITMAVSSSISMGRKRFLDVAAGEGGYRRETWKKYQLGARRKVSPR